MVLIDRPAPVWPEPVAVSWGIIEVLRSSCVAAPSTPGGGPPPLTCEIRVHCSPFPSLLLGVHNSECLELIVEVHSEVVGRHAPSSSSSSLVPSLAQSYWCCLGDFPEEVCEDFVDCVWSFLCLGPLCVGLWLLESPNCPDLVILLDRVLASRAWLSLVIHPLSRVEMHRSGLVYGTVR